MVVEPSPIIPGDKDNGRAPIRTLHDGINLLHRPVLTRADAKGRMVTLGIRRYQPTDRGQIPRQGILAELGVGHHILSPQITEANVANGVQGGENVSRPSLGRSVIFPRNSRVLQAIG